MLRQICLSGKTIDYRLRRGLRKSVGLKINCGGLLVSAPNGLSGAEIDAIVRNKADWVLKNLVAWQNKIALNPVAGFDHDNAVYPLLGSDWKPEISAWGQIGMVPAAGNEVVRQACQLPHQAIERWIMAWYQQHATACFSERIALYADKLSIPKPAYKLSRAKTRWGSCSSSGMIRLNWRLIQIPLHLIDYVVAHELCHLIEMNHSRAFWDCVAAIYPEYQQARRELNRYSLEP